MPECHKCKHFSGFNYETLACEGDEDPFWETQLKVKRQVEPDYGDEGRRESRMYICPKCFAVVLEEED